MRRLSIEVGAPTTFSTNDFYCAYGNARALTVSSNGFSSSFENRFLLTRCPIQLSELLIGLRAASFGTRQVKKPRDECHRTDAPWGDAISYTRTSARAYRYGHTGQRVMRRVRSPCEADAEGVPLRVFTLIQEPELP